jgi:hypothetical protein
MSIVEKVQMTVALRAVVLKHQLNAVIARFKALK